ncbi:MAG: hypothetical protein MOGMAGMI_02530 [Candidatus Omnitrophica bacterium]|nr:hypothetical protein [Candidatus Omnitrophota bacterium]
MSKKRVIQRKAARAISNATPQVEPTRSAFSIVITFDPARPQTANVNVMPLGGDDSGAHIDDVVTALRMGYEQALIQKGAWLLQQQLAAQQSVSEGNGGQG